MQLLILIRAKNQLSIRSFLVKTDQMYWARAVLWDVGGIEIEAFPLLAVICLGLNSKVRPLLGLTIHYHVMFTEHSTQLVKTHLCRKKIFSCQEQLSRAAHAKRHLMETPLVMLTGHQLHHRDFQGPGRRQLPTATSSHRQPDHSVLGRNGAGVFLFSVIRVS